MGNGAPAGDGWFRLRPAVKAKLKWKHDVGLSFPLVNLKDRKGHWFDDGLWMNPGWKQHGCYSRRVHLCLHCCFAFGLRYCSSKWALLLLLVPFLWWQIRLLCLVLAGSLTCFLHGVSFFYPVLRRCRHRRMIKDIRWHVRVKGRYDFG